MTMLNMIQNVNLGSESEDYMVWRSRDGKEGKFSIKQAYIVIWQERV